MPSLVRRRVLSPILTTNKNGFVTVPVGSIIEMPENLQDPGLNSITVQGEQLLAFMRDIEERTEHVDYR